MSIYTVLDDRDKTLLEDKIKESSEQFNIKTAEGQHVVINDSADFSFMDMKLYGKTTQTTTTGKNLLENVATSQVASGITFTINDDGSVTVNGTATANVYLVVGQHSKNALENGTYILSGCPSSGGANKYRIQFYNYDGNSNLVSDYGDGVTFDFTGEDSEWNIAVYIYSGQTLANLTFYPMLRLASITDPTYEQFTGKQPSPSPQYSQPLESKGKWGNLAQIEYIPKYSSEEMNVVFDEPYTGTLNIAILSATGTSQINVRYYQADGNYYGDSQVLPSATANNTWYFTNYKCVDAVSVKLYNVDADNGRTVEKMLIRKGSYSSVSDADYRPYSGEQEVKVGVYGKNLIPYPYYDKTVTRNGVTFTVNNDGSITVNGTASAIAEYRILYDSPFTLPVGVYHLSGCPNGGGWDSYLFDMNGGIYADTGSGKTITLTEPTTITYIRIRIASGATVSNITFKPQLEYGSTSTEFELYTKQSHISLVGDGLKGIPVTDSSLATYTDEKGKFICADEKNYARSLNIERVHRITKNDFTGSVQFNTTVGKYTQWTINTGNTKLTKAIDKTTSNGSAMCNILPLGWEVRESSNLDEFWLFKPSGADTCTVVLVLNNENYPNADAVTALLDDIEILFVDGTEIETPLTASEIASYKALKSNYKVTSVMNDCEAEMEIKYAHEVYDEGLGDVVKKVVESEVDGTYLKEAGESYTVSVSVASSDTQAVVKEAVKNLYPLIKRGWFGNALISITCTDATLWFVGTLRRSSVDPTLAGSMMRYGASVNPTEYQIYYNDSGKASKITCLSEMVGSYEKRLVYSNNYTSFSVKPSDTRQYFEINVSYNGGTDFSMYAGVYSSSLNKHSLTKVVGTRDLTISLDDTNKTFTVENVGNYARILIKSHYAFEAIPS